MEKKGNNTRQSVVEEMEELLRALRHHQKELAGFGRLKKNRCRSC